MIEMLIAAVLLAVAVVMVFLWLSLMITGARSAPFVPSKKASIQTMIELARLTPTDRVVDLGSGEGSIVLAAVAQGGQADGYEIQRLLVWWSRLRARVLGVSDRARFYRGDLWKVDCSDYDVVMLYIMPQMNPRMAQKLKSELRPGSRVIANTFPLPDWEPIEVKAGVYLYKA